MLFEGRKPRSLRISPMQVSSPSTAKWATPLLVAWLAAPPSSSWVTLSPVTARITSGPVMYIWPTPLAMKTKSVRAGE